MSAGVDVGATSRFGTGGDSVDVGTSSHLILVVIHSIMLVLVMKNLIYLILLSNRHF